MLFELTYNSYTLNHRSNVDRIRARYFSVDDMSSDLIGSGFMSSMNFIELLDRLESHFDLELDFEDMSPAEFTALDGFLNVICRCKAVVR